LSQGNTSHGETCENLLFLPKRNLRCSSFVAYELARRGAAEHQRGRMAMAEVAGTEAGRAVDWINTTRGWEMARAQAW